MNEFFSQSIFFGMAISLITYFIGLKIKEKWDYAIFNPLLISFLMVIAVLIVFDIDYETYHYGAQYLYYFITPATVCLAIPLYKQFETLKKNVAAVIAGILCGCIGHALFMVCFGVWLQLQEEAVIALLAKSVTTPIALGVCEEIGGMEGVTLIGLTVAGLLGSILGPFFLKLFRVEEPVAQGLGVGSASHAIGTSKMIEIGEVQAAMSSLAIVVTGLMTVVIAPIAAEILKNI